MSLLLTVLALTVGLHQGAGNEKHDAAFNALSTDLPERQKEIVDKHNDLRRIVEPSASNMLKMEWNGTAARNAKSWADKCIYNHSSTDRRTIENGQVCGENLFYSSVPKSWSDAIQAWFDENADYIYGKGPKTKNAVIGHYTQLTWYKSYMIACAVAQCQHDKYKYFYVCHYCPAGNVLGENFYKPYKEGEPCGDCPDACDNGLCSNQSLQTEDVFSNCVR
ncbi:cysteine-rich secretory protein 3-like [Heteronotia binoei]|uniref:cysteine-rich secretory protein 3-like n=1 Tax=Heteronotia binoei TaxID=13085 RepID=UPI00293022B7|nr:cysteine-rich secretory protein 3-like [Heteronotia binoei]